MTELKINEELRDVLPKTEKWQDDMLEESILKVGEVINPIEVWNGTIVDGYRRYEVIRKHPDIPFKICEHNFNSYDEAKLYRIDKELNRKHLDEKEMENVMTKIEELKRKQQEESTKTVQPVEAPAEQKSVVGSYAPMAGETKTERVHLLVTPRVLKDIRKIVKMTDVPANAIVCNLVEEYLSSADAQAIIAQYDKVFGDEVVLQHTGRKL